MFGSFQMPTIYQLYRTPTERELFGNTVGESETKLFQQILQRSYGKDVSQ